MALKSTVANWWNIFELEFGDSSFSLDDGAPLLLLPHFSHRLGYYAVYWIENVCIVLRHVVILLIVSCSSFVIVVLVVILFNSRVNLKVRGVRIVG